MTKMIVTVVAVLFCSVLLRDKSRTFSLVLSVAGVCVILLGITGEISSVVSRLKDLVKSNSQRDYISLMLKVLIITLLTQAVSDICRDNGENALAGACEFASKIIVVALVFPLFESALKVVESLLK